MPPRSPSHGAHVCWSSACASATHTTEHLDEALAVLRRVTAAILEA